MGVEIKLGHIVGKTVTLEELLEEYSSTEFTPPTSSSQG
ncbi:hypothetical protein ADU37_CDS14820 [Thermococcus sp. 2319x1]|nr:hypothetical protein ADU37_CDS14820 [Thermococcus sp. 2319x1]